MLLDKSLMVITRIFQPQGRHWSRLRRFSGMPVAVYIYGLRRRSSVRRQHIHKHGSRLTAKGGAAINSGPFLLSPLGRISLIRRFAVWLLPPLRGKFIAFHRGIPLSSTFKNPQGFGAISPAMCSSFIA